MKYTDGQEVKKGDAVIFNGLAINLLRREGEFQIGDVVDVAPNAVYSKSLGGSGGRGTITKVWAGIDNDYTVSLVGVVDAKFLTLITPVKASTPVEAEVIVEAEVTVEETSTALCPICGSPGFDLIFAFRCDNSSCQNSR